MKKQVKSSASNSSTAMWGGRFEKARASKLLQYSESISFDAQMYRQDIAGSMAHAKMLRKIGILTEGELGDILKGLQQIQKEIEAGSFAWSLEREDVHMNIEAVLTERTKAGAKLHTGRSRNDQASTDERLWIKDEIRKNQKAITALQQALVNWAQRDLGVIIPGYTHLQRAQPVLMSHHLLAYVEMLQRDHDRLEDCYKRADVLSLGSGAIAGSTLPLDRAYTAKLLGFSKISTNSMDATADRDYLVEYCSAAALLAVHISRLSEDLIIWSSAEFKFIRIGDAYTTGSSLMPQKKNPDVAELARGKSGRVIGNLVSLLVMLKGLALTYNRDMQEDKEPVFDTAETIQNTLEIMAEMLGDVKVYPEFCRKAASDPLLLATDLADWLVLKGVPFRQAHHIVGSGVALAEKKGVPITQISLREWKEICPQIDQDALKVFSLERAMAARKMIGAPNPNLVRKEVVRWQGLLKKRAKK